MHHLLLLHDSFPTQSKKSFKNIYILDFRLLSLIHACMEATYALVRAGTLHSHRELHSTPSFINKKRIFSKTPSILRSQYLPLSNDIDLSPLLTYCPPNWGVSNIRDYLLSCSADLIMKANISTAQQSERTVVSLPALTCDAHCEIISTGHLMNGFSLKLFNMLWLAVGGSVSMSQLPVQLGATLHILQDTNIW